MNTAQSSELDSEEDVFYFETDHLALRGNQDYSEVLKTLVVLCAQREKAIKDYTKAVELKKEAVADPGKVLEKIITGESLGMPDMHCIPEIPTIDWSKYNVKVPEDRLKEIYSNKSESPKKKNAKESKISNGRWSTEEQKKLEELLQVYPPEAVELKRFKKIAVALGNRTIQQVTSRVQKYFLKLYKAGLPIPGRIPKSAERYKKSLLHKHQRNNHYLWKPSTFFPELSIPVVMDDFESAPGPSTQAPVETAQPSTSSNYLIPNSYRETNGNVHKTESEMQLELLKRVRKVKIRETEDDSISPYQHLGFKCDYCGEEPVVGTRWHCVTCITDSIDFCTDCILTQMYSENAHPLSHHFVQYSDKDEDLSDTESNSGSGPCSSNVVNESEDSSSNEFNEEEDLMSDSSDPIVNGS